MDAAPARRAPASRKIQERSAQLPTALLRESERPRVRVCEYLKPSALDLDGLWPVRSVHVPYSGQGGGGARRGCGGASVEREASASTVTVLTRGEAVRSQQILRSPAETAAVAVRTGRTVRVFVQTPGFAAIERVEAVSFAREPVAPNDFRGSVQADAMELQLNPVETMPAFASCDELEHIYDGITRALGGADKLVFRLERLAADLEAELSRTRAMGERLALRRALSKLRATHRVARSQRGLLLSVSGDGEGATGGVLPATR
jgi:hypothetical protein